MTQKTQKIFNVIKKMVSRSNCVSKYELNRIKLSYCPTVEKEHAKKWRSFAHTYHRDATTICISKEIENLPKPYIYGIILHEFGHLLSPKKDEKSANDIIKKLLGIKIKYSTDSNHLEYI